MLSGPDAVHFLSRVTRLPRTQIAGMSASAGSGSLVASAATPNLASLSGAPTTVSIGSSNAAVILGSTFATGLPAGQTARLRLAYSADTSLLLGADFSSAATAPAASATRRRLLAVPSVQGAISTTVVSGERRQRVWTA